MLRIFVMILLFCGAAHALEPAQVRGKISPSIVMVRALGDDERVIRTGTGVVTAPGVVVTSCRVLAQAKGVQIRHQDIVYYATLQYPDVERGLCQLTVAKLPAPVVVLGGTATLRLAQPIYAVSVARSGELQVSEGTVSTLRQYRGMSLFETSAEISQDAGDTPLFDPEGRMVGMITGMVTDMPQARAAIAADAIGELPGRAMEALRAKSEGTASPRSPSFASAWAPRIALLEKSRGELTLAKALAILLDVNSGNDLNQLSEFEAWVKRLAWNSAYALGTDSQGNLIWGGAYAQSRASDASETALESCAKTAKDSCKVIMINGDIREQDLFEVAAKLGARSVTELRQTYLQSIVRKPIERVTGVRNKNSGPGNDTMGFTSLRE